MLSSTITSSSSSSSSSLTDTTTSSTSGERAYQGSLGTAIVRFGDVVVAVTGYSEASLRRIGKREHVDFTSVIVSGHSHATYYPGACALFLKVTFDPVSRRILGAQACGGRDGVDKRIDVLATAIAAHMTVDQLEHLELTYAPPFGTARDIVNTAGFLAYNSRHHLVHLVQDLPTSIATSRGDPAANNNNVNNNDNNDNVVILDVRPATVTAVPGALHIPYSQLRDRLCEINPKASIMAICTFGKTSYFAARILMQHGFSSVQSVMGGWTLKRPVVVPPLSSPSTTTTSTIDSSTQTQTQTGSTSPPSK